MPLKIVSARNKKTKSLYIRGSYLGIAVDKSCRTDRRSIARTKLKQLEGEIERGEYPPRQLPRGQQEKTFLSAALAYLEAGKRKRYVAALIKYFGETPLSEIDQAAVDQAAIALVPNGKPVTRNAYVYTPVSAILHHAGVDITVKRPKGFQGRTVTDWLVPEDAFGIIDAADRFDREFGALLCFLLYTGSRIGAALDLRREDVRLEDRRAWARSQKGQPHHDVELQSDLCDRLAEHLATHDRNRVFRLHSGGHLHHQLSRAVLGYLGIKCPVRRPIGWREPPHRLDWVTFHSFRHTWATWMRQAGTDVKGLVATGNWRNERSASRYAHAVARAEWERVHRLPSLGKTRGLAS
jgi:integrase